MESGKTISVIIKAWILLLAAGALFFVWRSRSAPALESDIEKEDEITHTEIAVHVGKIEKMTLHGYITAYGTVEPAPATTDQPAAVARISVPLPAVVTQVECVEGQHVEKGQALLVVDHGILRSVFGNASTPNAPENITSPISGTVTMLNIHPGEVAMPTAPAIEIIDLNRLVVAANIPAWQASEISIGQSASVSIASSPEFSSKVERIDAAADSKSNLISLDITVPQNQTLRPGQFARVSIASQEQKDALVVPTEAIVRDSLDRPFIGIVSDDQKQATLQLIEPGLREGDFIQIKAHGAAVGQPIVVTGAYGLLSRSDIKILNP
jgi:membrane fusion protein (multidrug efflux system)